MNHSEFAALVERTLHDCRELMGLKGGEYATDADRLSNFRRNAAALGVDPLVVWAVYAGKHWDAIQTFVADVAQGKSRERAEPIEGRFHDLLNYLLLGLALVSGRESERRS